MAKVEGFRIKNFRSLKDVTLGRLWNQQKAKPLTPMTAVIGKNGVGKSTLFDAFGFLADALKSGVEEACDSRGRGGFKRIRAQGQQEPIEFEVYYKEGGHARPITYEIAIDIDKSGRPFVLKERLRQRRRGQRHGWPYSFLILNSGKGVAWKGDQDGPQIKEDQEKFDLLHLMESIQSGESEEESKETEVVELEDIRKLGIATLGSLKQHPRISAFRKFIEGWYLSYFTPDAARSLPLAGPQKHLNIHGDNLGNVVQFMEREHPKRFQLILNRIAEKIPGIDRIETEATNDDRLLLRFNDKGFQCPFYSQQMSDGTLKVFAYLLLLEDPTPPPFLCIEEPVPPRAKDAVLNTYVNDSICGTWEKLADAVFPGGSAALSAKGWQAIGAEKSLWAEKITPHMDVNNNASPSFGYFRTKIMELIEIHQK
jgi:predicted ATPase